MDHLFASTVRIERLSMTTDEGRAITSWLPVTGGESVKCRLDLNFIRPGKDIPPAPVAGKAPDRIGLMFYRLGAPLKAGDRVIAIPNGDGSMPVTGTFEIRVVPDPVLGFSTLHHLEAQIIETTQDLAESWPDDEVIM
jgi:hypothetical protein